MTRMNDTIYVTDNDNLDTLTSTDEVFLQEIIYEPGFNCFYNFFYISLHYYLF